MKTKILFILTFNLLLCCHTFSQNITNTLGTSGVFKIKDGSTDYLTLNQSTGQVNILTTLRLENTTSSNVGVIFKGVDRFIHNFGSSNTFIGINSGNFNMTGGSNTAVGYNSLLSNTTGPSNTAVGFNALTTNTIGWYNTAVGFQSLSSNTIGNDNTALGFQSLQSNYYGYSNTAVGSNSLLYNISGYSNTALGNNSLYYNASGYENTSVGWNSLQFNISGYSNTGLGIYSLFHNITGFENTAVGKNSLLSNTTGYHNTALGNYALNSNTIGFFNTAIGRSSMFYNSTGFQNTALGYSSLVSNTTGFQNTAVGDSSLYHNTGNYNTALGYNAGSTITTGANLTCIGIDAAPTSPTAVDQITLGNIFVSSLRCNVTTITSLSDMRDKKNIKDLSLGLDFISKLKPRQFNWDKREWYDDNKSDGSKMKEAPTAGFIAQELDSAQTSANAEWLNLVLKDNPEKWEATPGNLLPIVVKAIQELKAENDGLKSENNELKERLSKIERLQNMLAAEIEKIKSPGKVTVIKVSDNK